MRFRWLPEKTPPSLVPGLKALEKEYPAIAETGDGIELMFEEFPTESELSNQVKLSGKQARIRYRRPTDAFRALGRLFGEVSQGSPKVEFQEKAHFETLAVMIDCSRNAVMKVNCLKAWLRKMALMGFNGLTLYTEDTYEIEGEPFFGYLRGRYTLAELQDLDNYGAALGIEVFPCIQTLAHLAQVLKWDAYKELQDNSDILLAGEERTYQLIEKMITAASKPFRSKRIHIGMDEAHGLGTGNYRVKHGERRRFDIMNEHLHRVAEICSQHGLSPMIWSDMYFRLGSETGDYYDHNSQIPKDVIDEIPAGVGLVYWDYYHTDYEFYAEWIDRHLAMNRELVVAPGGWTWNRFWALLPYAFATIEPCMQACKEKQVKTILLTLWGDDGSECDFSSAWPALQFSAEHAYSVQVAPEQLRRNFRAVCHADFDLWVKASQLDGVPGLVDPSENTVNLSKWLLWDDPLLGVWRSQLGDFPLEEHYACLHRVLSEGAKQFEPGAESDTSRTGAMSCSLSYAAQLALVLSLKCNLGLKLREAYVQRDLCRLRKYLSQEIPSLESELKKLWNAHRSLWMKDRKPFGWEVIELRYGGLMARLDTLRKTVEMFVEGETDSIPEFEAELIPPFPESPKPAATLGHRQIASPSLF